MQNKNSGIILKKPCGFSKKRVAFKGIFVFCVSNMMEMRVEIKFLDLTITDDLFFNVLSRYNLHAEKCTNFISTTQWNFTYKNTQVPSLPIKIM